MGNNRRFKAGRQARRLSQKEQIKHLISQVGYQQGLNMAMAAELEATKMERPADLEEWVESVIPDLSEDEMAEWNAMSAEEQQEFMDRLGQTINVSKALLDADAPSSPTPVSTDS